MPGVAPPAPPTLISPILAGGLVEMAQALELAAPIYAPLRDALAEDEHGWLMPAAEDAFWERLAAEPTLRDVAGFGPQSTPVGSFGAVEVAAMTSPDVRNALAVLASTSDVLHGAPIFDLVERPDGTAALTYHSPHDRSRDAGALAAEVALANVVELIRRASGESAAAPRAALLLGPAHTRTSTLARALGCAVHLGGAMDRLELDPDVLALRALAPEPRMHRLALRLLSLERAAVLSRQTAVSARAALRHLMGASQAPLDALAASLDLRPRALQRRLAQDGIRLRALVDDARRQGADRLLLAGARPMEVQRSLGYADLASLRRACRRWWGMGPMARRSVLAHQGPTDTAPTSNEE